ncbi:MAG: YcxB family protein [Eubacterium sp.]
MDPIKTDNLSIYNDRPEPNFICEYTANYKDYRQAISKEYKNRNPIWARVMLILSLLVMSALAYMARINNGLLFCLITIYILILICMFLAPTITAKNKVKSLNALYGENSMNTRFEFSDKIYCLQGKNTEVFEYNILTSIEETNDLYVIILSERFIIYVRKDSFIKGNADEFYKFIKSRCTPSKKLARHKGILKATAVVLIILFTVSIPCFVILIDNAKSQYYYTNPSTSVEYFETNKPEFDNGMKKVRADKEIMNELEKYGYASCWAEDFITLDNFDYVDITDEAVSFVLNNDDYYNGYVYYTGDNIPKPGQIGYSEDILDSESFTYIEKDDVNLLGANHNYTLSDQWYMVKQLDDNWYYYEYHSMNNLYSPI